MKLRLFLCLALLPVAAQAGPRTSLSYTISTDTADSGGVHTASNSYSNDGGVEVVSGISSVASPAYTSREGYVEQLTEVVSVAVTSAASSIAEGTSTQLSGTTTLDDATTSALLGSDIQWSGVTYPISSINLAGLLTAGSVYTSSSGTATGTYLGASGFTTVQVTGGPYTGGGIPDAYLYQYFGPAPNPAAAPGFDADGTGQTNLFKYLAGLNPLDGSRFVLTINAVTGQPGEKALTLVPVYSGRTYTVQFSPSLTSPAWQTLTNTTMNQNGTTWTVTDQSAGTSLRFYRVQISMP